MIVGLGLGAETQRSQELLNSALYVGPPQPLAEQRTIASTDVSTLRFLQRTAGDDHDIHMATCWLRCEQAPNPSSRVALSDQIDGLGQRRVVLDWQLTDLDYESLIRSARRYARALGAANLGRIKLEPWLVQRQRDWWGNIRAGWHHMGTTRMAESRTRGVVDPACKVFGVDNLFVAGTRSSHQRVCQPNAHHRRPGAAFSRSPEAAQLTAGDAGRHGAPSVAGLVS